MLLTSCESESEKQQRKLDKERMEYEIAEKRKLVEETRAKEVMELELIKKEREAQERHEQEIYTRFIHNSLSTGTTPYVNCFGNNRLCEGNGCSEIKVKSPRNSDVIVSIKQGEKVVRHAYIKGNSSYTFQMPNGTYQPYFYYGKGWNPEKEMVSETCQHIKGGFISEVTIGKDSPQNLSNDILTYELILQSSGNFSTQSSSLVEAF